MGRASPAYHTQCHQFQLRANNKLICTESSDLVFVTCVSKQSWDSAEQSQIATKGGSAEGVESFSPQKPFLSTRSAAQLTHACSVEETGFTSHTSPPSTCAMSFLARRLRHTVTSSSFAVTSSPPGAGASHSRRQIRAAFRVGASDGPGGVVRARETTNKDGGDLFTASAGTATDTTDTTVGGWRETGTSHTDQPPLTPWVRSVISGVELLRNPRYNKGMSFSDDEREKMHLQGLLPPAKFTQHTQVRRVMRNVRQLATPVDQHFHLIGLLERNERLFYRVLQEHIEELLPVMYTPTVGKVCKKFSELFYRPRGLYITGKDKGKVHRILKNWPEKRVKLIVVTDGERVMGLGDLGAQGMGVASAKTNLYTALGGLDPSDVLPVCLDVGTNKYGLGPFPNPNTPFDAPL